MANKDQRALLKPICGYFGADANWLRELVADAKDSRLFVCLVTWRVSRSDSFERAMVHQEARILASSQ